MSQREEQDRTEFQNLSTRLYRLCLGLLGDETSARDAAQESLLRAWTRRRWRRRNVSWWTWAAGFAFRVCRESRRRPKQGGLPAEVELRLAAGDPPTVDRDRLSGLRRAIERLPDRQREVVVLRFLIGQSTNEAAETLGCPAGTIKSNLHKALSNLQGSMERAEESDELRKL